METFLRRIDRFIWGNDLRDLAARFVGCQIVAVMLPLFGLCGLISYLAGRCR